MMEQASTFAHSQEQWTAFHNARVSGSYPKWPVEVMVKTLFGSYLKKRPSIRPGQSVLDVGCGFGNNLLPFLEAGCSAYGVEISDEIAQLTEGLLKEKGYSSVQIREGNNRRLPFADRSFDLVVSNNVLHYEGNEENILKALSEYTRVMKKDGFLYLMTVGPEHAIYKRANSLGNHQYKIQNYDFRDGEVYFYFDNEKYLEHYMKKFFNHVEIGRVTEKLMTVELDFLVAVCSDPIASMG